MQAHSKYLEGHFSGSACAANNTAFSPSESSVRVVMFSNGFQYVHRSRWVLCTLVVVHHRGHTVCITYAVRPGMFLRNSHWFWHTPLRLVRTNSIKRTEHTACRRTIFCTRGGCRTPRTKWRKRMGQYVMVGYDTMYTWWLSICFVNVAKREKIWMSVQCFMTVRWRGRNRKGEWVRRGNTRHWDGVWRCNKRSVWQEEIIHSNADWLLTRPQRADI